MSIFLLDLRYKKKSEVKSVEDLKSDGLLISEFHPKTFYMNKLLHDSTCLRDNSLFVFFPIIILY